MSTQSESWARLRSEPWINDKSIDPKKNDSTCKYQVLSAGYGDYVYDDYSVTISSMPAGLTAEDYLLEFSRDPNAAVANKLFNVINVFKKRSQSPPAIGDIFDIDIAGPDDGSIVLVALSAGFGLTRGSSWFDIQTIECKKYGTHPENGAREFGFENVSDGFMFYTRGVSRGHFLGAQTAGSAFQTMGWTGMMKGISESIRRRGGQPKENSFKVVKVKKKS
jgi:hypothetical protein